MNDTNDDLFYIELQNDFYGESLSLIDRFESIILNNTTFSQNLVDELFRIAHSIKGGAAAVGLSEISKFTHQFEDYLTGFRNAEQIIDSNASALLLEFSDLLRCEFLAKLSGTENIWVTEKLLAKLSEKKVETAISEVQVKPVEKVKALDPVKNKKNSEQVKVDIQRLEAIFDTIGELVIFKNQLKGVLKKNQPAQDTAIFDQMEIVIKDLYNKALGLRMTNLQPLFQKMQRSLRDLSIQLDKKIIVKTCGEDTEIDRNLFEQLTDPLIHLIRNAIDHGIETKQQRTLSNKSETATIEINSYYESGQVIIEIKDDGRGIDPEKVFDKALQKKLIPFNSKMTDFSNEEINHFIFYPGFSTAAAVSDLSGRGVGLDVVKTTIEKFQGQIQITSQKNKGSCFKLCLPLTTSLIDGITFQAGTLKFIIPNTSILSIDLMTQNQLVLSGDQYIYTTCFDKPILCIDIAKMYSKAASWAGQISTKVSVRTLINNQHVCFLFDQVHGQCQVVVKPLPKNQQSADFIGSAINDDGHVQLILDLSSVYKKFTQSRTALIHQKAA
jgi:two-component system, chemotaxis family, sensor kinase CheA